MKQRNAMNDEISRAIRSRSAELGRALITQRAKLDLSRLSPAEEKIVTAVSEYVGVMKREGKDATRTFLQLRNRGLLDAAETAVAKAKPTQGYQNLADAELSDLSYEQIIVDHPDEFSPRAHWYARRTLGLDNDSPRPPAHSETPVQRRTANLLSWLQERAEDNGGQLPRHTNAQAASALGIDMGQAGRVFGNIQSRLDFACYLAALPPLGLTAAEPFDDAWQQVGRTWAFPVKAMQAAAQTRIWTEHDFDLIKKNADGLPGQAHLSWQHELQAYEPKVRSWAFSLKPGSGGLDNPVPLENPQGRNPNWTREELIIVLDLYLRFRRSPPSKASLEVREISEFLRQMAARAGLNISVTFRNANGVYMKMMNYRSIDPEYTVDGRVGLSSNSDLEHSVWAEYAEDDQRRAEAIRAIRVGAWEPASIPSDLEASPTNGLAELERKYLTASPETKSRLSKYIERGPVGAAVKKANGFKCQVCEGLGLNAIGFLKSNGEPYVEAHHVMPVSKKQVGSLSASNIMTVCANHHRQLHYGDVEVTINDPTFDFVMSGVSLSIKRAVVTDAVISTIEVPEQLGT
ncbi:hypothetical protein PY365_12465 [Roseiarcaceae bacterium H3SJ34-1]|uniref:HNH endonuclease n=1 Tax=Terripilifer ovatus TaxID=3032367 RepID=UPI003AB9779C|nr:hypothetical protein [Roseiarcaceae bacterium H3SJ34-1]